MSDYLFDDPTLAATGFPVANGEVDGPVRSAALSLDPQHPDQRRKPEMAEEFGRIKRPRRVIRCSRCRFDRHSYVLKA
ncbi:hypothetical protein GGE56_001085 [Rhizobium leguminosarum]|jgi:hypothetical protein|nr:hypothetical protein [Rhizobium leguminosarum]